MREIKFRGETVDTNKWIYGDLIQYSGNKTIAIRCIETWMTKNVDIKTIGEYTGYKDKGETEIYQGDIIECQYDLGDGIDSRGIRYKTIALETWQDFIEFIFEVGHDAYTRLEVIGNIYENKDLKELVD